MKWLFWTIIGGLAFLGCQAWEWHHLITGEHATLIDGQIQMVGQTTRVNPWGPLADPAIVSEALKNSSIENLALIVHDHDPAHTLKDLTAMPKDQLLGMINVEELHVRRNGPVAFGGYFYGITGFHGFHVFSGVIINIIMLLMTSNNVFEKRGHYLMIEKAGLYWHFVDLVWVFVFLCFYLI
jgi:cytochrome c oxidase subunit 3